MKDLVSNTKENRMDQLLINLKIQRYAYDKINAKH